jgi:hypothetical protein
VAPYREGAILFVEAKNLLKARSSPHTLEKFYPFFGKLWHDNYTFFFGGY